MKTATPKSVLLTAHLLREPPESIDRAALKAARRAVSMETTDLWDALANANQIQGNIPRSVAVAIVYRWLRA